MRRDVMATIIGPQSSLNRGVLRQRYLANRARTGELFALFEPAAYESRPIPLRHPPVFYEGHLPSFSFQKLVREALGGPSIDAKLERLFARGIDPPDVNDARRHEPEGWPSR